MTSASDGAARFCYMYSAPLVRKQGSVIFPVAKPLSLADEKSVLIDKLQDTGKSVVWEQHVASHETFANALPTKIDVLHYSGHGEPGELCGEDSHGQLTEITVKQVGDFLSLLNERGTLPLVFVSACHSYNIGRVFEQAGCKFLFAAAATNHDCQCQHSAAPHVVCINAKEQVMDVRGGSRDHYSTACINISSLKYRKLPVCSPKTSTGCCWSM